MISCREEVSGFFMSAAPSRTIHKTRASTARCVNFSRVCSEECVRDHRNKLRASYCELRTSLYKPIQSSVNGNWNCWVKTKQANNKNHELVQRTLVFRTFLGNCSEEELPKPTVGQLLADGLPTVFYHWLYECVSRRAGECLRCPCFLFSPVFR